MAVKDHSLSTEESKVSHSGVFATIQEYFHEKAEGLNIFEKVMLSLYSLMTIFFFFSALYLVFTKGFKF